jgi:hypothetical protein
LPARNPPFNTTPANGEVGGERSFAEAETNGEVAPIPAVATTANGRQGSTRSRPSFGAIGALLILAGTDLAISRRLFDGKPSCMPVIGVTALLTLTINPALG